ncbi:hypothetical protein [uncultured Sanguibacteroides sp.]|uniref:hypothetical protein n=1 Tax=uncultured Sanguibacteroides sp. TaxID=1635151 RepID=UPI0025E95BC9|nr:hypothetical protein [uncultured Sanguibacteroides sp.]
MKAVYWILWMTGILFWGCSESTTTLISEGNGNVMFSIVSNGEIDSAQVFFFRKRLTKDTLIHREVIGNISETPRPFVFELPAGYYSVVIYGNVSTKRIVALPPYAQENILLDYSNGEEHPMIYWGRQVVNVGKDEWVASALLEITSYVELTIKGVPAGVDQIDVDLLNTGAGVYLNDILWQKLTEPNLIQSLYDVKADTTYVVRFACFPTVESLGMTSLDVRCYDREGLLVYRGKSAPFSAISRSYITCSFGTNISKSTFTGKDDHINNIIQWEYNEVHR